MRCQLDVRTAARAGLALATLGLWAALAGRVGAQPAPAPPALKAVGSLSAETRAEAMVAPLVQPVYVRDEVMVYFKPGDEADARRAVQEKLADFTDYEEAPNRRVLAAGMTVIRPRPLPPASATLPAVAARARISRAPATAMQALAVTSSAGMAMEAMGQVRDRALAQAAAATEEARSGRAGTGLIAVVKTPRPPQQPKVAAASAGATVGAAAAGAPVGSGIDLVSDATALADGTLWGLRSIRATYAWQGHEPRKQPNPVSVVVLDTGVNTAHPNLAGNIKTINNPDGSPMPTADKNGHGSHVAGIIGAVGRPLGSTGQPEPVVGVEWDLKMVPIQFLGEDGLGRIDDAITAVDAACKQLAADPKARLVINMSWVVGDADTGPLKNLIDSYKDRVLFVAAAGNADLSLGQTANDNDVRPIYPASYSKQCENLISVLAVDRFDQLPEYSNYGRYSVDIAAPGGMGKPVDPGKPEENIYSTWMEDPKGRGNYATLAGTSMATAYVSAAAAFLWVDKAHEGWSPAQIKDELMKNARPIRDLASKCKAGGVLNLGFLAPAGTKFETLPGEAATVALVPPPLAELDLGYVQPWAFVPPPSTSEYVLGLYKREWPPAGTGTLIGGLPGGLAGPYPAGMPRATAGPVVAPVPTTEALPLAAVPPIPTSEPPPSSPDAVFADGLAKSKAGALVQAAGRYDFAMYTPDGGVRLIRTSPPVAAGVQPGAGAGGRRIGFFAVRCTPAANGDPAVSRHLAAWAGAGVVQSRFVSLADSGRAYSAQLGTGEELVVGVCSVAADGSDPRFGWLAIQRTADAARPWKAFLTWSGPNGPLENGLQTDVLLNNLKVVLNADLPLGADLSNPVLEEDVDPAGQPNRLADDPLMATVRVGTSGDTVNFSIAVQAR